MNSGSFIAGHGLVRYTGRLGRRYPRTGQCEVGACRLIRQQDAEHWGALAAEARGRLDHVLADLAAHAERLDARPLMFDHCHVHGWVRGLACHDCNVLLGAADAGRLAAGDSTWAPAVLAFRLNCPDCRALDDEGKP